MDNSRRSTRSRSNLVSRPPASTGRLSNAALASNFTPAPTTTTVSSSTARPGNGIMDTDDEGGEEAFLPFLPSTRRSGNLQTSPQVIIPVRSTAPKARSTPVEQSKPGTPRKSSNRISAPLESVPSDSTPESYSYDEPPEPSTPGTSTVVTPAEMDTQAKIGTRSRVSVAARAQELRTSRFALNTRSNKRKRGALSEDDEDEEGNPERSHEIDDSPDAQLARLLQVEDDDDEVGPELVPANASRRTRMRKESARSGGMTFEGLVDDSISFSLSAADATRPGPSSPGSAAFTRPSASSRPRRAARESAEKSIAAVVSAADFLIDDSQEDDADFTEYESDFFEDLEDVEESEKEVVEPIVSAATSTPSKGSRSTRATRNTRTTRAPRISRQRAGRRGGRAVENGRWTDSGETMRAHKERQKLIKHHPEVATMWDNLEAEAVIKPIRTQQPATITRQLKSFQLEGLDWMSKQEKTKWRGGILGDEMGMGKTIQAVSLIMSDYPARNPTLVVVPPVALVQWQNEIREYTHGKLKVLLFHGAKVKKMTLSELKKYDILMTSYSTLENTHRKERKGWVRNDEVGEKVLIKEDSILHTIHFHRIILDEAHSIKSRNTGTAKACFALSADFRWCLTGTPLQNRIGEFFSLFRFLGVRPFACYLCKMCSCKEIHWAVDKVTRRCTQCSHRGFDHISLFNLELLDPIISEGSLGAGKLAQEKLQVLIARIMLRRLKLDHTASMELPAKDVVIHSEFFGEAERDFASSIMTNTNRTFDTYVAQGVMLNNYANIFGLIMQMRQVADHPDMITKKHAEGGQNILVCAICDDIAEDAIRSTCRHDFCRACVRSFINNFTHTETDPDCPRCHIPLSIDLEQEEREQDETAVKKSSIINRIKMSNWTSSTKIEMLVYELATQRSAKRTVKSIVFSQFTSMLQLVEWRLRRAGFNTVMLDGTMTPTQRQSSIEYFMNNPDVEVFLVSLKAGGVALNLTEASKVYLIDPWWNPAAEWQSADRCHRIGQGRPCAITRLVIEDSVESRMVLLQEKKARMIRGTVEGDEQAMGGLSTEDMGFLFRGS